MPGSDYVIGVVYLLGILGGVGVATAVVARRCLAHLRGAPLACAVGIVASTGLLAVHLVPAMLGVMTRGTVLAAAILLVPAVLALPRQRPARVDPTPVPLRRDGWWSIALAVLAAGAVALNVFAYLRSYAAVPITHVDTISFHLPQVGSWIQSHSIWANTEFLARFPTGTYPQNGDVMFLAVVLPFHNDAFVRLVDLPFLALLGVGVYALGRELRAPFAAAALFAAVLVSMRSVAAFAVDQLIPDVVLLATLAAGTLFLVRHFRSQRTAELVLAGLGLGIAFGTKWYGVSLAVVVVATWVVASLVARRAWRVVARQTAALAALIFASGGVWLVRNWVTTGNPLFPVKVRVAGVTVFDAPRDVLRELYGFTILDRLGQWDAWRDFIVPDWRLALGLPGALIAVLVVLAFVRLIRDLRARQPAALDAAMLACASALLAAAYTITPATAQGSPTKPFPGLVGGNSRYLVPALVLGAPVAAWVATRAGRLRPLLLLAAGAAVLQGLRATFDLSASQLVGTLAIAVAGAAVVAVAIALVRRIGTGRARRAVSYGLAVALLLAGVAYGEHLQKTFNRGRYAGRDATIDWILVHAPGGHRIGITGDYRPGSDLHAPILPAFGPRYGNHVTYIGRDDRGILVRYSTRSAFVAGLRRSRVELLEVGLAGSPLMIGAPVKPGPPPRPPEAGWARSAGYRLVARSPAYELYEAPGVSLP